MTPRERVLKAINHEETDFVPYNIFFDEGVREKYAEWVGDPDFDRDIQEHFLWVSADQRKTELPNGEYIDEWGGHFKQGNIFHLVEPRLPEPSLKGFTFPDFKEEWRYETMAESIAQFPGEFVMAWFMGGFCERGCWLRGMENYLIDFAANDSFLNEFLDGMLETMLDYVEMCGKRPDIDAIMIGDDYGQQRGLLMGPVLWRKYIKPRLAKVYSRIHELGKYAVIHSCGDNTDIMDDFIEIGLDIFHPFQPEAMNIVEMKRLYGHRLTFNGGVGTQGPLVLGTPDDVRKEVRNVIREMGKGGGFVLETTKALRPEVPMENIAALIDEFVNQKP